MVAELELIFAVLTRVGCIGALPPMEIGHLVPKSNYNYTLPLTMAVPVLLTVVFCPPGTDMLTSHKYT